MQRPGRLKGPDLPGSVGLLRRIIDQTAIGMALLGANGRLLYVNRAFRGSIGYTAAQCAELALKDIIHPDDRKKFRLKARGEDGIERRFVRRDGSVFHGLTSLSPLGKDGAGTPFRFILQIVDIEERKQAELALAEEEWRWEHALLGSGQGVWDIDIAKNWVWISRQWEKALGIKSDTIAGYRTKWLARVHADDRERMGQAMLALKDGRKSETNEVYRLQRADRKWVWVLSRGRVVKRAQDGTALRIIGVTTDISQQKDTEAKLAAASERLELALEAGGVGIFDIDIVAEKHQLDDQTLALFGMERSRTNGSPEVWKKAVHPDDLAGLWEKVLADRASGVTSSQYDFRVVHRKPRAIRHIRSLTRLIRGPDGEALRLIGICWDITDDIRRTRQLQDTLAELGATGERLDIALEAGNIGTFDADIETGIRTWDDRTYALHGVTRDEYDGSRQGFFALMHPDDRQRIQDTLAALLTSGTTFFRIDYRVIHPKSGAVRHIRTMTKLVRDADGTARRRVGVCWDITDELEKARQLIAATERLELALEAGNIGVFDVDVPADKRVLDDRTLAHYGLSKQEYDGSREAWTKIIHPDDRARVLEQITADRASGVALSQYDFRVVRRASGAIRHIRSITRQALGEDGRVQRVVGVSWDITDHIESAAQLASASERLNLALKAGNIGIFDTDIVADRHRLDDHALALFGIRPEDADEKAETWAKAIHPDDLPRIVQQYTTMLASRASSTQYDFRVVHRDTGAIRNIRSIARFIRDEDGAALRSIGATWDVTDEIQRTTQLEEAMSRLAMTTERLELALEAGGIGVFDVDIVTNKNSFDDRALAVHGLARDAFDGSQEAWERTILPEDRARVRQEVAAARASGASHAQYDHRIRHPETGAIRYIRSITRYMRGPTGAVTRGVGVVWDITDHIERNRQLREALSLLDAVMTSSPDLIFARDLDSRYLFINKSLKTLIGRPEADIIGKAPADLYPPEIAAELQAHGRQVLAEGVPLIFEETGLVDGAPRTYSAIKAPLRDEQGNIIGLLGISRDVTEIKAAEAALRHSEMRWQFALDGAGDGIWDWNVKSGQVFFSRQLKAMLGYGEHEFGTTVDAWIERIHPDDLSRGMAAVEEHFSGKNPDYLFEHRLRAKDGSWRWILSRGKVMERDADGKPLRAIGTHTDITDRVEQTRKLSETLTLLDAVMTSSPDIIYAKDLDSRYLLANKAFEALAGRPEAEIVGRVPQEIYSPEDAAAFLASDRKVLALGMPVVSDEMAWADGVWRTYSATKAPLRDEQGNLIGLLGISRDVTEIKKAEAALRETLELLNAVMSGTPDLIFVKDRECRYLVANHALEKILGHTNEELRGKSAADMFPPEIADRLMANDRAIMASGEAHTIEEIALVDGVAHTFLSTKAPRRDAQGNVIGVISISRDVTEIKLAEAALWRAEMRWQFALDGSGDGIWDWNVETGHVFFSRQWKAMLGHGDDEIEPSVDEWSSRVHPEDLPGAWEIIERHMLGETPDFTLEHRMRAKDGSWRWILDRGKIMERTADGKPLRMIGTHTDITTRKETEAAILALNQRLQIAVEASGAGIFDGNLITTPDFHWGERMYELYDLEPGGYDGTLDQWLSFIHPDDVPRVLQKYDAALNETSVFSMDFRIRKQRSGNWRHIRSLAKILHDPPGRRVVGMNWDITDHKELAEALFEEKERLRITLHSIGDSVITTDADARIAFMNPVAEEMTGWSAADAAGRPLREIFRIVDEVTGAVIPDPVAACLALMRPYHLDDGAVLIGRDGERRNVRDSAAPVRTTSGEVIGAVLVFQDVTKARTMQQALEHSATHDSLTGLPNRAAFERSLREARESASPKREHVLCFIDLDRFKIVNDGAGHAAGDALLREVANLLRRACRAEDVAARLGGDEFALLFRDCGIDNGEKLAQRFLKSLADLRFTWNDRAYQIGASMGLTLIGKDAPPTDELMSRVDIACYTAKTAGRNQIAVYGGTGSPAHRHHREVQVAAGIRNAIETDRFRLYAQEVLDIAPTKGNKGGKRQYEILLRMLDEKGAIMEPSGFIPASERYDLMGSIDRWVIRTTFRSYGERLRRAKDISIALNLSANSLNDPFLWPFLQEEFEASGLPPGQISFEITETAVINNLSAAKLFLSKARAAGCGVMLDDFGTGLSSFVYLRQFPVDGVKIDGGFIRQMTENPIDRAIVESINAIGHRLGAVTVAEQVEDEATLELVRAMGVDRAQGYAISYPEPFDNLF